MDGLKKIQGNNHNSSNSNSNTSSSSSTTAITTAPGGAGTGIIGTAGALSKQPLELRVLQAGPLPHPLLLTLVKHLHCSSNPYTTSTAPLPPSFLSYLLPALPLPPTTLITILTHPPPLPPLPFYQSPVPTSVTLLVAAPTVTRYSIPCPFPCTTNTRGTGKTTISCHIVLHHSVPLSLHEHNHKRYG